MNPTHSWKWLVPRLVGRQVQKSSSGKIARNRPCLAIERLEKREVLSAAGTAVETGPPPIGGDTQILIGLLRDGLKVTQDEFQLLKILGSSSTEAKTTFEHVALQFGKVELVQLSDTLIKVGEDLVNGELTAQKLTAAENKVKYLEFKMKEVLISSVNLETQKIAMPILDSLFADATSLVQGLLNVQGAGDATQKQTLEFLKVSADVLKIDGLVIRAELDSFRKAGKGQQEFFTVEDFQVKIDGVFQNANEAIQKLGEATSAALLPAVQEFHEGITNLLGSLGGGGDFEGGILLPPTDDTIT